MTGEPRRRWVRSTAAIQAVLATVAVLVMSLAVPSPPLRAQDSPGERQAIEALCPASAESWDILFLMDESQSLRHNDPDRARIDAAKRYISDLGEIAGFGDGTRIRVALAAFGSEFDLRMGFTDLLHQGAIEAMYEIVDGFGADDLNTDYVLALYGALDPALDWSAACNRVVWLTDGQHDLGDAHRGDRSPRPYDGLQRRITGRSVANAVGELLIPAVCGVADGAADEVAEGYGDLRSRVEELGVEIEDHLYYVGEFVPGDTKTLIDRMERGDCGRPMNPYPLPDWVPPPVCGGLPELYLPTGTDLVWSGELPDGVAPSFVRSVIVQVTGDSPELTTGHPDPRSEGDGSVRRITLDFFETPWSEFSPEEIMVRGERVEGACVAAVLEPPALEARVVTSPIFPDTTIDLLVLVNGRTPADERFLEFSVDGEPLGPVMVEQGSVRIPAQDVGDHTFEVRLVSDHADPVIASAAFTVSPKPAICEGLPEPQFPAGRDVVWSGELPDGVAPAFVRSVIVQATGDPPVLSSDHPSRISEEDGDFRRLTLDFSEASLSGFSPAEVAVTGEGVDESCLALVLEPPSPEARIVTSPIFPDTPGIEIEVRIDGSPITAVDARFVTLRIDGQESRQSELTGEGRFEVPISLAAGDHTFGVRIESSYSDPAVAGGAFTVSLKPDGPILSLAGAGLDPVAATEFTIPITIDDEGRPGEIRILPADPIVGTDGTTVSVEILFPDGRSAWMSDDPMPDVLTVILGDSVQTTENHVLRLDYQSRPSDPAGETRTIPLAVPVDIDHPRNPAIEAIIVVGILILLLLLIWLWLYGINRLAGRIRRPIRMRYAHFQVNEEWAVAADFTGKGHRPIKHTPSRLEAGPLRAKRKVYLRVWKPPTVELSMIGSRRFSGRIGEGFDALELPEGSVARLSKNRLHQPVVVVDVSGGPPFKGVVMAPTDPSNPTEEQLSGHVRRALERLPRPDHE